jgi:TPR repeat protein
MRRTNGLVGLILLTVMLAACAPGSTTRVEPEPPPQPDPAVTDAAFREAMVLAREGRMAAAAPYYKTAAENGHTESQYVLATMYRTGRGMPRDMEKAVEWYSRAAEAGYPLAQFTLGNIFMEGDGVPRNVQMALKLFREAGAQGYPQAQYNLGVYHYAAGTAEDNRVAEQWFLEAAKQGEPAAQYALGKLYAAPHDGVRLDPVRAYAWFEVASSNGSAKAEAALDQLGRRLSAAERAAARSLARRIAVESTQ